MDNRFEVYKIMSMNITVVKDQRRYEFIDPHRYKTTMTITIRRSNHNDVGVFFVPVEDTKADIDVRDSDGKKMIQLSPHELRNKFEITPEDVRPACHCTDNADCGWVPVLLSPHRPEYEIIVVTFESPMDRAKYGRLQLLEKYFAFKAHICRFGFSIGSKYVAETKPHYLNVSIKTGKYYKIDYKDADNPGMKSSTIVPNLVTLRKRTSCSDEAIVITCKIRVADVITQSSLHTAWIITLISTSMYVLAVVAYGNDYIELYTLITINTVALIPGILYITRSKALTMPDDIMRGNWIIVTSVIIILLWVGSQIPLLMLVLN